MTRPLTYSILRFCFLLFWIGSPSHSSSYQPIASWFCWRGQPWMATTSHARDHSLVWLRLIYTPFDPQPIIDPFSQWNRLKLNGSWWFPLICHLFRHWTQKRSEFPTSSGHSTRLAIVQKCQLRLEIDSFRQTTFELHYLFKLQIDPKLV